MDFAFKFFCDFAVEGLVVEVSVFLVGVLGELDWRGITSMNSSSESEWRAQLLFLILLSIMFYVTLLATVIECYSGSE